MPRPGPRPYECVKRAWHSERHQPIRGTIIQEIFRSVKEIHRPATKKNKEWQDKLPAVVLRTEEIMYCKANSEAEYMDLNTLWDRVNDAINTIIRRDESSETEGLLQPCIEAALYLGCTPRRAPRSQRNCSPRYYLSPQTQKPAGVLTPVPAGITDKLSQDHTPISQFMKPIAKSSSHLGLESCDLLAYNNCFNPRSISFPPKNAHPSSLYQFSLPKEACPKSSVCAVYPLYYDGSHTDGSELGSGVSQNLISYDLVKPAELTSQHELLSCHKETSRTQADASCSFNNPVENDCDLSLRLGPLSVLYSLKGRCSREADNFALSSSQEGIKFSAPVIDRDDELLALSKSKRENPLDLFSRKKTKF